MNDLTLDTTNATAIPSPALIATPQQLNELRLKLHVHGYHPVPIVGAHVNTNSAGKRPTMTAWQTDCLTAGPPEIESWSKAQRHNTNTGILCGALVGVDVDVLDEALSAKLVARAVEMFGPTSLKRIGRAPKMLLVYRVEAPHDKLSTPDLIFGEDPADKSAKAKVEILAQGQQFVAFGIHPDTRAPYAWPEKSPLDITLADVPLVTLELLEQFVKESEGVLREAGARTKAEIKDGAKSQKEQKKSADKEFQDREAETEKRAKQGYAAAGIRPGEKPSREKIASALRRIPNDLDYDEWIKIGFALYGELGDSGRDLWEAWSAAYTGRRVITVNLDPELEQPELRQFEFDPIERVLADRGAYIAAVLTIGRAYVAANRPGRLPRLASFEGWSDLVRSSLVWLGKADPVLSMDSARAEDPERGELSELLEAWAKVMGRDYSNRAKLADVILKGTVTVRPAGQQYDFNNPVAMEPTYPELYSALESLAYRATGRRGQKPDARLLGNYLRKFKGKIVDGKRFSMKADDKRGAEWWVEEVQAKPMSKATA